jgi:hypothetical protein
VCGSCVYCPTVASGIAPWRNGVYLTFEPTRDPKEGEHAMQAAVEGDTCFRSIPAAYVPARRSGGLNPCLRDSCPVFCGLLSNVDAICLVFARRQ